MDIPVSKVRKVLKIAQEPISLETPIGEEEDSHLGDFIEDRQVVSPAEAVINLNLKEQTESVLKTLTPREEKVIKMRFGVGDGSEHTLEEVGQSFAVTASASGRSRPRRCASCGIHRGAGSCGRSSKDGRPSQPVVSRHSRFAPAAGREKHPAPRAIPFNFTALRRSAMRWITFLRRMLATEVRLRWFAPMARQPSRERFRGCLAEAQTRSV
jgi:hypothetical protein